MLNEYLWVSENLHMYFQNRVLKNPKKILLGIVNSYPRNLSFFILENLEIFGGYKSFIPI